ncbi:SH3 domain protein [Dictyocaulus viviparus]|uniref:SH3 domain protein n=1 Tax=Dictyocaulus viviparus TaxID=29172 RepID=A0A0D8Y300_DICVI|nr:SH3 domain protein [Dictyocaulus viviparus]
MLYESFIDTTFSVSTAKAFFEAAKKPELRQAAVLAAKNPFVRNVAKQAVNNPETRNQLIAALEKQFAAKSTGERPKPSIKPQHQNAEPPPPPPPPHRGTSSNTMMSSGFSMTTSSHSPSTYTSSLNSSSINLNDYQKPLPKTPSSSSSSELSNTNGSIHSSVVSELQNLRLNKQELPPYEPHAIVKHSFIGSHQDELSCEPGDIVILKRDVDEQWIYGKNNRTGRFGIIPLSFLDIRVPLNSGSSCSGVIATAIYDYDSNTPGDLTFRMYDQITAIERIGPEWLRGSLNGREGIFPANFVSCRNIDSLPMSQPVAQLGPTEKLIAVYDYSSGVQGDLEFKAGDMVEIVAPIDQDWIHGRVNGREGLAPLTYLAPCGTLMEKSEELAPVKALGETGRIVTAIADHYTNDPEMLYFSKGDRIIIIEDVDAYWYRGKVEGFKTLPAGLFPKSVVRKD